jgi:flagellar basal-body rod protein FlgB
MFPSMFNSGVNRALEETVAFAERRHQILAGNVANMDTPDYKTKDLSVDDFQESLKGMLKQEKGGAGSVSPGESAGLTGSREPTRLSKEQAIQEVRDASKQVVYHDGSDDNLETQITQISKNQGMHSVAVALLKSQYRSLQTAISGSVNV